MQQLNLIPEAELKDAPFMSAKDKRLVLKQWARFLDGSLKWEHFTKKLYEHLHLHCGFIAHYDQRGFYNTYFVEGADTVRFLAHFQSTEGFDKYGGCSRSAGDYGDLINAMIGVGSAYIPNLIAKAQEQQKRADIAQAFRLLEKHGTDTRGVLPLIPTRPGVSY